MEKPTVASVTADLVAEQDALDAVVASLAAEDWERATPSPRWAVRDQIGHLAFFDMTAALAIDDPEGFVAHRESFVAAAFASATSADDATLGEARAMSAPDLLDHWRRQRPVSPPQPQPVPTTPVSSGTGRRWARSRSSPPG